MFNKFPEIKTSGKVKFKLKANSSTVLTGTLVSRDKSFGFIRMNKTTNGKFITPVTVMTTLDLVWPVNSATSK